uniref:Uncharacterized protein n=1 Tax=Equus caballus TaxID=9796 RepID=A0A9L0SVD3_HORSE
MRIHSLTLLPFLLLAAQVLLAVGAPTSWKGQGSRATKNHWIPLGKPQIVQRPSQQKPMVNGEIVTPDQASCTVTMIEHAEGTAIKAMCSRMDHDFSCVFTGNPTSCIEGCKSDIIYWKQIAYHLSCQRNLCEDANVVLRSRVCSRRFPESNFKLVYSTLIDDLSQCDKDITPWWHIIIHEAPTTGTTEVIPFYPGPGIQTIAPVPTEAVEVTETTPTVPIVIQQTTPKEQIKGKKTTTTQQPKTEQTTTTVPTVTEETTPTEEVTVEETTTPQQPQIQQTAAAVPIVPEETTPTEQVTVEETTTTQQPQIQQTAAAVPIVPEETTPTEQVKVEEITTTVQPKLEQTTTTVPIVMEETTPTEQVKVEETTTTQQPQIEETTPTESFYNEVTTPKPNYNDDSGIKIKQTIIYQSPHDVGQKIVQQSTLNDYDDSGSAF